MQIDRTNTSYEYWDKILDDLGLSLNRGLSIKAKSKDGRTENIRIAYVSPDKILSMEAARVAQSYGRPRTKKHGPEA